MTSRRPYRKTPGPTIALAELVRGAGTQFDPKVVEAISRALAQHTIDPEPPRHAHPKAA